MDYSGAPVARILESPSASFWLKRALRSALDRDVVDAAHDAEILASILRKRADGALGLPSFRKA